MSLMMPSILCVDFPSGLQIIRHEDCLSMSICSDLCEVYIKLFTDHLQGFQKMEALVRNDFKSKVGEKLETLV